MFYVAFWYLLRGRVYHTSATAVTIVAGTWCIDSGTRRLLNKRGIDDALWYICIPPSDLYPISIFPVFFPFFSTSHRTGRRSSVYGAILYSQCNYISGIICIIPIVMYDFYKIFKYDFITGVCLDVEPFIGESCCLCTTCDDICLDEPFPFHVATFSVPPGICLCLPVTEFIIRLSF